MKLNFIIISLVILFFIFLIYHHFHHIENFNGAQYIESNNLVNSSRNSWSNRQYVMNDITGELVENEYEMKVLYRTAVNCTAPGIYDENTNTCICSDQELVYDSIEGCILPPAPSPFPTQKPPTKPPTKSCPQGYVYDHAMNACLGKCLINEYYDVATGKCVKDCSYSWTDWTICDTQTGKQTRDPIIYYQPNSYGQSCPTQETANCPVDCSYSWTNWTICDIKKGTKTRDPIIVHPALNGGEACPGIDTSQCDIDCSYSWSDWTTCDPHSGTSTRDLTIYHTSVNNGTTCPSPNTQTKSCGIECAYNLINGNCNKNDGYMYYNIDMVRDPQNKDCLYNGYYGNQIVSRNQLVKSTEMCPIKCDYDLTNPHCNPVTGTMFYTIDMVNPGSNSKCLYNNTEVSDNQIVESNEPCAVDCEYKLINPICVNGTIHKTVVMIRDAINRDCRYNPKDVCGNDSTTPTPTPTSTPTTQEGFVNPIIKKGTLNTTTTPSAPLYSYPIYDPSSTMFSLNKLVLNQSNGQQKIKDGDLVDTGEYCKTPCNTASTPTSVLNSKDCVGAWGGWSDCKINPKGGGCCGQERIYSVTQKAGPGGNACPYTDGQAETQTGKCVGTCLTCI